MTDVRRVLARVPVIGPFTTYPLRYWRYPLTLVRCVLYGTEVFRLSTGGLACNDCGTRVHMRDHRYNPRRRWRWTACPSCEGFTHFMVYGHDRDVWWRH